ncbi:cytochrome P450 6g1-like [Copidosoma floridanum]|uniref:cytochrome P450 6g1-like n=1 Tax=Copidosoma floridanum TaxID=29053 RepID=UPI0006C9A471|nr:cytochrome P450 6g1-like [Copidosoma floridanum]
MDFTLLFFAFAALLSIYLYLVRNYDHWRTQKVPTAPGVLPGFGHALPLLTLRENFGTLISRLYARMGLRSMYGCYLLQTPALLIREPHLLKAVLRSDFPSFRNNLLSVHGDLDPVMANNPFFARDDLWRESRVRLSANFSGKRMRFVFANSALACQKLQDFVDRRIGTAAEFESRDLFARVSGEVVASTVFGIDSRGFEDAPERDSFARVAARFFEPTVGNAARLAVRFFLPRVADRLGVGFLTREMDRFVRRRLGAFVKSTLHSGRPLEQCYQFPLDLDGLDEDAVTAQATSLLFDGYEACTNVLSFMMYRLAGNAEVQTRAREEVARVLAGELSYEGVKGLEYLEWVVMETLRMNPVFGDLSRVCTRETVLEGSDGLSCRLRPGDVVLMSPESLHMDEEYWPRPGVFDPERFASENRVKLSRYAFLGFSEGARMCPGKRMGLMIVKTVAAAVLQRYSIEVAERSRGPLKLNPNSFASVVEGGLWIRLKPLR